MIVGSVIVGNVNPVFAAWFLASWCGFKCDVICFFSDNSNLNGGWLGKVLTGLGPFVW
jgi:hypothetical protein